MDNSDEFDTDELSSESFEESESINNEDEYDDVSSEESKEKFSNAEFKLKKSSAEILANKNPLEIALFSTDIRGIAEKAPNKRIKYGSIFSYPIQETVAETFLDTKGITSLQAPTGYGKTLQAYIIANKTKRCLIIVPSATLKNVWEPLGKSYGFINDDPEKTNFFIYDPSVMKRHKEYLDSKISFGSKEKLIIICKDSSIETKTSKVGLVTGAIDIIKKFGLIGNEFTVIVDEAHMKKLDVINAIQPLFFSKLLPITRELLMSGSEINLKENGFSSAKIHGKYNIDHSIIVRETNEMPLEKWEFIKIKSKALKYLEDIILECVSKHNKLAISWEDQYFQDVKSIISSKYTDREIRVIGGATKALEKFNKDTKGVIYYNYRKSTGLNIQAGALLVISPGSMRTENLIQTTRRVIRHDNPNRNIKIYMLCVDMEEYLRSYYAYGTSHAKWLFGRDADVNSSMVYKSIGIIRALGENPDTVERSDACIILSNYPEIVKSKKMINPKEETIKWWEDRIKEDKIVDSIVTKELIDDIIYIF
jgi:hypothetical protein